MSRFLVLEQHPAEAVRAAAVELGSESTGPERQVVDGWRRPVPGVDLICVGRVGTSEDAAAAVMCAVSGSWLVVDATAPREVIDRLCDDLRRLGDLDHRVGVPDSPALSADQRQLLALLLGGATLGQAARALHLSRRTADRRLAAARAALGASSTPEAIAAAAKAGVRPVTP